MKLAVIVDTTPTPNTHLRAFKEKIIRIDLPVASSSVKVIFNFNVCAACSCTLSVLCNLFVHHDSWIRATLLMYPQCMRSLPNLRPDDVSIVLLASSGLGLATSTQSRMVFSGFERLSHLKQSSIMSPRACCKHLKRSCSMPENFLSSRSTKLTTRVSHRVATQGRGPSTSWNHHVVRSPNVFLFDKVQVHPDAVLSVNTDAPSSLPHRTK